MRTSSSEGNAESAGSVNYGTEPPRVRLIRPDEERPHRLRSAEDRGKGLHAVVTRGREGSVRAGTYRQRCAGPGKTVRTGRPGGTPPNSPPPGPEDRCSNSETHQRGLLTGEARAAICARVLGNLALERQVVGTNLSLDCRLSASVGIGGCILVPSGKRGVIREPHEDG